MIETSEAMQNQLQSYLDGSESSLQHEARKQQETERKPMEQLTGLGEEGVGPSMHPETLPATLWLSSCPTPALRPLLSQLACPACTIQSTFSPRGACSK